MPKTTDSLLKICIFGNQGVGKSTLINNCLKKFTSVKSKVHPKNTIGVCFYEIMLEVEGRKIKLQLWELSGDERYKFLFKDYVRGAAGGIFIFDLTDKTSLKNVNEWLKIFRKSKNNASVPVLMVGNKSDLEAERKVSQEDASNIALSHDMIGAFEVSANNEESIEKLIINFVRVILQLDPKKHFVNVFKNKLNLRILLLLKVYRELSLTNMVYHLGKSKSTLSRRTRELIRLGLIKSYSKEEKSKLIGSKQKKYSNVGKKQKFYSLNPSFNSLIEKEESWLEWEELTMPWDKLLEILTRYSYLFKKINYISNNLNEFIEALENLLLTSVAMEDLPLTDSLNIFIENLKHYSINYRYLSEKKFNRVQSLRSEFYRKLDEILKDDEDSEKSHLILDMNIPILGFIKYSDMVNKGILGLRQGAKETQEKTTGGPL